MQVYWHTKNPNATHCTLFFSGWAMSKLRLEDLIMPSDRDLVIFSDYRHLETPALDLNRYQHIDVVAWSMGVKMSSLWLEQHPIVINRCCAINGTLTPIDNEKGIPEAVFNLTLKRLSPKSLNTFYSRMAQEPREVQRFLLKDDDDITLFREELMAIANAAKNISQLPENTQAIVGEKDLIFRIASQEKSWHDTSASILKKPVAHWDEALFFSLLKKGGLFNESIL